MGTFLLVIGTIGLAFSVFMILKEIFMNIWGLGSGDSGSVWKRWFAIGGITLLIVLVGIQCYKDDEAKALEATGGQAYREGTLGVYKWILRSLSDTSSTTPAYTGSTSPSGYVPGYTAPTGGSTTAIPAIPVAPSGGVPTTGGSTSGLPSMAPPSTTSGGPAGAPSTGASYSYGTPVDPRAARVAVQLATATL